MNDKPDFYNMVLTGLTGIIGGDTNDAMGIES